MNGLQRRLAFLLVAVNVGVHYGDLPAWIPTLGLVCIGWRWLADLYRIPCPGKLGAAFFALVATIGVWFEFSRLIGDPASTALLVIMVSLKTFEVRGLRDLMIITYLCLLLLMSKLLSTQNVSLTFFLFADVIAILSLMHLYHLPQKQKSLPWRRAARLLLQASPILIALFILFPRFNFSFFGRTAPPEAQVGFSGVLRPGSVAQLAQNDQIAFRAFFRTGVQPPRNRLYWRAAVLDQVDGLNWDPDPERQKMRPAGPVVPGENVIEIMMENGQANWLYTLDWPVNVVMATAFRQDQLEQASGLTFALKTPLMARETYAVSFNPIAREISWDQDEVLRASSIGLPSSEMRKLLLNFRSVRGQASLAVKRLQSYFMDDSYSYSLAPPAVESVDEFLFKTKIGFCEHYAGAVATLLRHLEVPARVVVGYHGGSPSLMNDYVLIYQRDAHAWVEYWDAERASWTRLDPTLWVGGERLAIGGPGIGNWQNNPLAKLFGAEFASYVARANLALDQAEILWVSLLLRYDFTYQKELFAKWGLANLTRGLLFLLSMTAVLVLAALSYAVLRWNGRRRVTPEVRLYRALCGRLAKAGLPRQPAEGPLSLLERAEARWPEKAGSLRELFGLWIQIRFGGLALNHELKVEWSRALKKLAL